MVEGGNKMGKLLADLFSGTTLNNYVELLIVVLYP
jgi:hypothetical protein